MSPSTLLAALLCRGRLLLNRTLQILGIRPGGSLDPVAIEASAQRRTGLVDTGQPPWPEGLARACAAFEEEARISPLGRPVLRQALVDMQANRLRLVEARRRFPERFATPLQRPIFVVGLPRSGTTLVQRLLCAHPEVRGIPLWQASQPVLLEGPDRRRTALARRLRLMGLLAPELQAKHAFELDSPEECIALFDAAGGWNPFLWRLGFVPVYLDWLLQQDANPAFATYLELLRWIATEPGSTARRLVVKTPNYTGYLGELARLQPDAVFIWTHRDPAATVPSYASLQRTMYGLLSEDVDPHALGAADLELWATLMERGMAAREQLPADRVLDLDYEALRVDPLDAARRALAHAGLAVDAAVEEALRAELSGRAQHRHGKHLYALEDFGLSRAQVHERFAVYLGRHLPELRAS